jgi:predicted AlkP superfamily phosphohydrolase/phosphomutase
LAERGYLTLTGSAGEPSRWANRAARLARRALAFLPGGRSWRERLRARRLISRAFVQAIDWSRTRAWFGLDRGLWINTGDEPHGMVDWNRDYEPLRLQLIAELEALEDPETGRRVVRKVHCREALYRTHDFSGLPDLVIEPMRARDDPRARYLLSERLRPHGAMGFVGPSSPISGYHTSSGILLLRGHGVPAGARLTDAAIIDVAPTILRAMSLPGGEEMDGTALLDFGGGATSRRSRSPGKPGGAVKSPTGPAMSEDAQRQVEDQLKSLGYLD